MGGEAALVDGRDCLDVEGHVVTQHVAHVLVACPKQMGGIEALVVGPRFADLHHAQLQRVLVQFGVKQDLHRGAARQLTRGLLRVAVVRPNLAAYVRCQVAEAKIDEGLVVARAPLTHLSQHRVRDVRRASRFDRQQVGDRARLGPLRLLRHQPPSWTKCRRRVIAFSSSCVDVA